MIPAAQHALTDRRIRGNPREVYFWLHDRLDVVTHRPMTIGRIVIGTGLQRNVVHRAVQRLHGLGYLDLVNGEGREYLYRLVHALE